MRGYNSRTGLRTSQISMVEKRGVSVTFDQITDYDPLNLKAKYKTANDQIYLKKFYTVCSVIPITLFLSMLFYSLWYISPST